VESESELGSIASKEATKLRCAFEMEERPTVTIVRRRSCR
jgi:hypothetical protein